VRVQEMLFQLGRSLHDEGLLCQDVSGNQSLTTMSVDITICLWFLHKCNHTAVCYLKYLDEKFYAR
jgi:hypothetical protein